MKLDLRKNSVAQPVHFIESNKYGAEYYLSNNYFFVTSKVYAIVLIM